MSVHTFPATVAQRSWWTLKRRCADPAAWDPTWAVRLSGPLAANALEAAAADVVARHPGLRTSFALDGGALVQRFAECPRAFSLVREDLSERADPVAAARARGAEIARAGFDPADEARVRLHLLRLGPDDHVAVFAADHLAMEAWAYQLVLGELRDRYAAHRSGHAEPVVPVARHLGDHARVEQEEAAATGVARRRFWRRELAGLGSPFPEGGRGEGHLAQVLLEGPEAAPLLAPGRGETVFVRGLAALLRAVAGAWPAREVAVGTLVVNRAHPGARDLVGVFVNLVLMRIDLADVADRERFLAHVGEVAHDALRRSTTPLDEVLDVTRRAGTPFDVFFQHVNAQALVALAAPAEGVPARAERLGGVEDVLPHRWGLAGVADAPFALPRPDAKAVIEAHLVTDGDRAAAQLITDGAHLDEAATRRLAAELRAELVLG